MDPILTSHTSHPSFTFEAVILNHQGDIVRLNQGEAPYRRVTLAQDLILDLVWVPGGTFMMGTPSHEPVLGEGSKYYHSLFNGERPQHQVTVAGFWLGKYAVTQAQYRAVMGENPSHFQDDSRPVEQVNWDEAMEFCDRLSDATGQPYTLPSDAQWEYAARAGGTTPFHQGETITTALANYNGAQAYGSGPPGIYRQATNPVGCFPPNDFGLYDLHGNVWEWCLDTYHEDYENAPTDGSAWTQAGSPDYRMIRGGSWYCYPHFCRSASRDHELRDTRMSNFGFRVAGA
ncbi:MAG: formylglycine-generating enzyme family protein [Nodosilinea sp.]